ncbi:MAG: DUF4350 domain-containing protein [Saprospiraceae bacterium]
MKDSLSGNLPALPQEGSYVFIGEGMYMRPQDRDALLEFVGAGNTALIAAKVLPFDLMFYLYYDECNYQTWEGESYMPDSLAHLNFAHPAFQSDTDFVFRYVSDFKNTITYWNYYPDHYFCEQDNGLRPIGRMNGQYANFLQVPYGQGFFYLHAQPQVFTNYFIVQPQGRDYASRVFGHLSEGTIYWDEYSRVSEQMAYNQNSEYGQTPRNLNDDHALRYILEQPPLAWAWYTLVGMGLLYMIFRAKRRQHVIPVVYPPKNSSLEFVQAIGRLYYQRAGHQQLAIQSIRLLRSWVRERYNLPWKDNPDELIRALSLKSGVEEALVATIVKDANNIPKYTSLLETELVKFHQRLERFYEEAR